mmetsp:Transcript_5742/g.13523  ORF Transcript_5742/g.13523 Transcript_5742/m.13523 type:complete len:560 (+) Transcript_5742:92-1771(+)
MGFKPRPPPPPSTTPGTPGKTKKGFVEKTSRIASPGILRKSLTSPNKPETIKKRNSWWNLEETEEDRPKNLKSVGSSKSSVPPAPSPKTGRKSRTSKSSVPPSPKAGRKSRTSGSLSSGVPPSPKAGRKLRTSGSLSSGVPPSPKAGRKSRTSEDLTSKIINSTRKTIYRHKVLHKGVLLYEWEQNPKFVSIYYPTPDADYKAFCNIFAELVQLGTKPKNLPAKWFLSHDTGGQVDVEESSWKQCKQHCKIILAKENKGSTWARALKDDRVDEIQTIVKARPQVDRAQSQPVMSPTTSPSSMKQKVSQRRSSNDSDDQDSDSGERRRGQRARPKVDRAQSQPAMSPSRSPSSMKERVSQRRRSNDSDDQDSDLGERRTSRSVGNRRKWDGKGRSGNSTDVLDRSNRSSGSGALDRSNRSNRSSGSGALDRSNRSTGSGSHSRARPLNRRSSSQGGGGMRSRRSGSQSKPQRKSQNDAPPRRTRSSCSAAESPVPVIFVDPNKEEEEEAAAPPKFRRRQSRNTRGRRSTSRSRSFDSIDEELPDNIEIDMNSDLVSVLGA